MYASRLVIYMNLTFFKLTRYVSGVIKLKLDLPLRSLVFLFWLKGIWQALRRVSEFSYNLVLVYGVNRGLLIPLQLITTPLYFEKSGN